MYIKETCSTNDLIKEHYLTEDNFFFLRAGFQRGGKGQNGNKWESQADKNLLGSILLKNPSIAIDKQFILTMITSLAITEILGIEGVCIKWPNDIYYFNKKLCGILIENSIYKSAIKYSIIGIGLNVNQTEWSSDVPNPVSLKMITKKEWDIDILFSRIIGQISGMLHSVDERVIKARYMQNLYRKGGYYKYFERDEGLLPNNPIFSAGGLISFLAKIIDVTDMGQIVLEDESGNKRFYHFKQVGYVIDNSEAMVK